MTLPRTMTAITGPQRALSFIDRPLSQLSIVAMA